MNTRSPPLLDGSRGVAASPSSWARPPCKIWQIPALWSTPQSTQNANGERDREGSEIPPVVHADWAVVSPRPDPFQLATAHDRRDRDMGSGRGGVSAVVYVEGDHGELLLGVVVVRTFSTTCETRHQSASWVNVRPTLSVPADEGLTGGQQHFGSIGVVGGPRGRCQRHQLQQTRRCRTRRPAISRTRRPATSRMSGW